MGVELDGEIRKLKWLPKQEATSDTVISIISKSFGAPALTTLCAFKLLKSRDLEFNLVPPFNSPYYGKYHEAEINMAFHAM